MVGPVGIKPTASAWFLPLGMWNDSLFWYLCCQRGSGNISVYQVCGVISRLCSLSAERSLMYKDVEYHFPFEKVFIWTFCQSNAWLTVFVFIISFPSILKVNSNWIQFLILETLQLYCHCWFAKLIRVEEDMWRNHPMLASQLFSGWLDFQMCAVSFSQDGCLFPLISWEKQPEGKGGETCAHAPTPLACHSFLSPCL